MPSTGSPALFGRALWVWEVETYAMLENASAADEAVAILRRHGIDTVYLYADAFGDRNLIVERPARYEDVVTRLHASGLRVYALLGSAYLNTENYILPAHRGQAEAMLRRVLDYNRSVPFAARFDGINLDIEPEAMREWSEDSRADLVRHYLDMSAALMRIAQESPTRIQIGPATMLGWDKFEVAWRGQRRLAIEHVVDLYDYVTLMDYRRRAQGADGIIANAVVAMAYASRAGKQVVIGLEIGPHDDDATFRDQPPHAMEAEMQQVVKALGSRSSFGGFALHHYHVWREWLSRDWP